MYHDLLVILLTKSSCCVLGPHHMFPSLCVAWFLSTADGCARLLKKYPRGVVCRPSNLGVAAPVQDSVHLGDPAGQAAVHLLDRPVGQEVVHGKHGCGARIAKQPRLLHARRDVRQRLHRYPSRRVRWTACPTPRSIHRWKLKLRGVV